MCLIRTWGFMLVCVILVLVYSFVTFLHSGCILLMCVSHLVPCQERVNVAETCFQSLMLHCLPLCCTMVVVTFSVWYKKCYKNTFEPVKVKYHTLKNTTREMPTLSWLHLKMYFYVQQMKHFIQRLVLSDLHNNLMQKVDQAGYFYQCTNSCFRKTTWSHWITHQFCHNVFVVCAYF